MNNKIAVVEFGSGEAESTVIVKDVDWYIFDETADKDFEIKLLCENYDRVYEIKELK